MPTPDRLFPVEPAIRELARRFYRESAGLPIVSPHGHVDAELLARNEAFSDPASLFVTPDHYVTRILHADGVALSDLGVGRGPLAEADARAVWRRFCARWSLFAGTAVRTWLADELSQIFGVTDRPSAQNADALYDHLADRLCDPAYRPRALFERFGIEVLATTDDPADGLSAHRALAADPTWSGRVIPAFRPDRHLDPGTGRWPVAVAELAQSADVDTGDYAGYLRALESRRRAFAAAGATTADHGPIDARTDPLSVAEASRIYRAALDGSVTGAEAAAFRRHMLFESARMACDDGLVMTLHAGVLRNHHRPTAEQFGADVGGDLPLRAEFTEALRPLLERFGTERGFRLVVFTVDESTWSRELAPMAGFYPAVYVGVPWWFLDAPDAIRRFHAAVTETAGFDRLSGFVDDTRAFCSIPVRHDMSRRLEAGTLARLVAEGRLAEDEAAVLAARLAHDQALKVFRLGTGLSAT